MEQAFRLKKSLGQHFLQDVQIAYRIVECLDIQKDDQVFEIGPGKGALTYHICKSVPKRLYLIEKDHYWADYHCLEAQKGTLEIKVFHEDAMLFPWESLSGSWKMISNLPYNIGSPLIWDIVSRAPNINQAVFMVQKEVAERLYASPGNKDYGALSVWVQSFFRVEWGFVVTPYAFNPPPKVDSAVVILYPKALEDRPKHVRSLAWILKICFQQRRKQIQSILRRAGFSHVYEGLERVGISPLARPETLSTALFQELSCEFCSQPIDFPLKR